MLYKVRVAQVWHLAKKSAAFVTGAAYMANAAPWQRFDDKRLKAHQRLGINSDSDHGFGFDVI